MSINFPPKTASAASYRFWYVVFPFIIFVKAAGITLTYRVKQSIKW